MSSIAKETLTVTELGKWGPKVGNEYLSWSKNIKDSDKGKVVKGGTYLLDLYIADSGKRYINSVSTVPDEPAFMTPTNIGGMALDTAKLMARIVTDNKSSGEQKPRNSFKAQGDQKSEAMSKDEWAAKDRRISRQGVIQVAVQVTSSFDDAVVLANKMLEFVNGGN